MSVSSSSELRVAWRPPSRSNWGASSRSQRNAHELLALTWWSKRISVFHASQLSTVVKSRSGRLGNTLGRLGATTCRSRLKKKCAWSGTIGPPITPPHSILLLGAFSKFSLAASK